MKKEIELKSEELDLTQVKFIRVKELATKNGGTFLKYDYRNPMGTWFKVKDFGGVLDDFCMFKSFVALTNVVFTKSSPDVWRDANGNRHQTPVLGIKSATQPDNYKTLVKAFLATLEQEVSIEDVDKFEMPKERVAALPAFEEELD